VAIGGVEERWWKWLESEAREGLRFEINPAVELRRWGNFWLALGAGGCYGVARTV